MVPFSITLCDSVSKLTVNCGGSMKKKCIYYRDSAVKHIYTDAHVPIKNLEANSELNFRIQLWRKCEELM